MSKFLELMSLSPDRSPRHIKGELKLKPFRCPHCLVTPRRARQSRVWFSSVLCMYLPQTINCCRFLDVCVKNFKAPQAAHGHMLVKKEVCRVAADSLPDIYEEKGCTVPKHCCTVALQYFLGSRKWCIITHCEH